MKSPFVLPLYLAALWIIFLLGFTVVSMAAAWIPRSGDAPLESLREVLERSPVHIRDCLPVALAPAVLFAAIRAARNPVSRPFSLLLPVATVFCILVFAPKGLRLLGATDYGPLGSPLAAGYIRGGALIPTRGPGADGSVVLAARVVEGATLEDVVVARPPPAEPRLAYAARGEVVVASGIAVVRLPGGADLPIGDRTIASEAAEPSASTSALLADLGALNREIAASFTSELGAVLLAAGLATFLCFSTVVIRMTRWPLLSFVILGLLWRYALVGIRLCDELLRPALAGLASTGEVGSAIVRSVPALALLAGGAVFLLLDLVFVRFDFWKREIEA